MDDLQIFNRDGQLYTDSREVAKMIGKDHKNLLRDIDGYIKVLGQSSKLSADRLFHHARARVAIGQSKIGFADILSQKPILGFPVFSVKPSSTISVGTPNFREWGGVLFGTGCPPDRHP